MCKFLKESKAYNNNNIIEAMKEAFMSCDRSLLTEEAIKEMRLILEEEEGEGEGEQLEDEDIERLVNFFWSPCRQTLFPYNYCELYFTKQCFEGWIC